MSSSGKSSSSSGKAVAQRLIAHAQTKADMQAALNILADAGLIKDIGDEPATSDLKRSLTQSIVDQCKINTPYGPLIQSLEIDAAKCKHWEYTSPFA